MKQAALQTRQAERASQLQARDGQLRAVPANKTVNAAQYSFSSVATRSAADVVQAKLKVNNPDDKYEREADQVADLLMNVSTDNYPPITISPLAGVQRKCAACEEEEKQQRIQLKQIGTNEGYGVVQRKCAHCEEEEKKIPVQRKESGVQTVNATKIDQPVTSGGQPLDAATRSFVEPRLGFDFGKVRIHSDPVANRSAAGINALAYTSGNNIVFGKGQYQPTTISGRRLLIHELTHVVQQTGAGNNSFVQRKEAVKDDPLLKMEEEVKAMLTTFKDNWKHLVSAVGSYKVLKPWIEAGNTVLIHLATHSAEGFAAIRAGDTNMSRLLVSIVESDKVMFDLISWYVTVYANILSITPSIKKINDSFKADDRDFTGREDAEEFTELLSELCDVFPGQAKVFFDKIDTAQKIIINRDGKQKTITATNALQNKDSFKKETEDLIELQTQIQLMVEHVNNFLDNAFDEGLKMAKDAVIEFYSAKGSSRKVKAKGAGKGAGKGQGKGKGKGKGKRKDKCSAATKARYNREMHRYCDKPRSCSEQNDTCATATAKASAGQACVDMRTKLQQRCFEKTDPGYGTHMQQIAEASAALRECNRIMMLKCVK